MKCRGERSARQESQEGIGELGSGNWGLQIEN
jgi:hypothetical protein